MSNQDELDAIDRVIEELNEYCVAARRATTKLTSEELTGLVLAMSLKFDFEFGTETLGTLMEYIEGLWFVSTTDDK